jgi:integrase/recombinase XerD
VPLSPRLFGELGQYLELERPATATTDRLFVVLKGRRRGQPLSLAGLDQVVEDARGRAGLAQLTRHQLRHTCLTRVLEAGMPLEAIQAQAGHRSIESTRVYLHLTNDCLGDRTYVRQPGEDWYWCYLDEVAFEIPGAAPAPSHR